MLALFRLAPKTEWHGNKMWNQLRRLCVTLTRSCHAFVRQLLYVWIYDLDFKVAAPRVRPWHSSPGTSLHWTCKISKQVYWEHLLSCRLAVLTLSCTLNNAVLSITGLCTESSSGFHLPTFSLTACSTQKWGHMFCICAWPLLALLLKLANF